MNKEYIWHCPTEHCKKLGTILFKTSRPVLDSGEIKCPICNKIITFDELEIYNKNNVKKYLEKIKY